MEASVVIPTYNKANYLELTLESLLHQHYERSQYEVIVVDDGSDDETSAIVEQFSSRDLPLQYLKQAHSGLSTARNAGIRTAQGTTIIFVDDDCICNNTFIAAHTARHNGASKKAVLGVRKEVFARFSFSNEFLINLLKGPMYEMDPLVARQVIRNIPSVLPSIFELLSSEDVAKKPQKIEQLSGQRMDLHPLTMIAEGKCSCPWNFFLGSNASVDKCLLLQVGLFDEDFQGWGEEDIELAYRLFREKVVFDATLEAIVYHQIHPRNRETNAKDWLDNCIHFAEKHKAPEIYLRIQLFRRVISSMQYEAIVGKIEAGLLSEDEKCSIKEYYDRFLVEHLKQGKGQG